MIKKIDENLLNKNILIIEDNPIARVVLREIFSKNGFTSIEEAENGKEGLEKINSFYPDLVIMDAIMPEMNGEECCKNIRQHKDPMISNVPILFQTSLNDSIDKAKLFAAGATDYISKPVDQFEIIARTAVHLEKDTIMKEMREFSNRVANELKIARDSQLVLIPDDRSIKEMEKDYNLEILGHYRSCSELGGDFWGFKSLSNEELAIYIVDFSGHGVGAALNVFRLHALMQHSMSVNHSPGAYLTHLNAMLEPLLPVGQFATMFYGIINHKNNTLSYASAAAPTPLLFRKNACESIELDTKGVLLGVARDSVYQTMETEMKIGDSLLLYSDALTETPDDNGKMISKEKIAEIFQAGLKNSSGSSRESFDGLLKYFDRHYSHNTTDDLTLTSYFKR